MYFYFGGEREMGRRREEIGAMIESVVHLILYKVCVLAPSLKSSSPRSIPHPLGASVNASEARK